MLVIADSLLLNLSVSEREGCGASCRVCEAMKAVGPHLFAEAIDQGGVLPP
jgi:hypothetical protein